MKFMVLVKATKDSESGALPDEKLLTEMGKYNEELVKAGIMLAGEGLAPELEGRAGEVFRNEADGDGRAVCGDEGAGGGVLAVAGEVEGRGD